MVANKKTTLFTISHIAAILEQTVVAKEHDQAGATVHQERAETDGKTLADDVEPKSVDAAAQVEQFCGAAEETQLPAESDGLGNDGGPGNTLNAPFEHEDEERVEYAIDDDGKERACHSHAWMASTTQYRVRTEVEMCHDIAKQDDVHVLASIGEGDVACSEEVQNLVEEGQANQREKHAEDDVQGNCVTQNMLSLFVFSLPKSHTYHRACTYAHHRSEGCRQVHEWTCHSHSADGKVAQALTHEDAIYYIIYRGSHHRDDGGQTVLPEQATDGLRAEFCGDVLLHTILKSFVSLAFAKVRIKNEIMK